MPILTGVRTILSDEKIGIDAFADSKWCPICGVKTNVDSQSTSHAEVEPVKAPNDCK